MQHPSVPPQQIPSQQQRILVHHQNNPLMTSPDAITMPIGGGGASSSSIQQQIINIPPPQQQPIHSSYIGSQRFAMAVLSDMDSQNISPKSKYRELKKKFKYLVYVGFFCFWGYFLEFCCI